MSIEKCKIVIMSAININAFYFLSLAQRGGFSRAIFFGCCCFWFASRHYFHPTKNRVKTESETFELLNEIKCPLVGWGDAIVSHVPKSTKITLISSKSHLLKNEF